MYWYLPFALLFFLTGCKQTGSVTSSKSPSFMDSLVGVYIAEQDSLEFKDPTTYTYKVLKAYYSHDTAFFREMHKQRAMAERYLYPAGIGSCKEIKPLSALQADEAYRFIHSQSFCNFTEVVTVYKSSDSIQLHYIAFIPPAIDGQLQTIRLRDGTTYNVGDKCTIRKAIHQVINEKEWDTLKDAFDNTDFWGLKTYDHRIVLDGSNWTIQAVLKEPRFIEELQTHAVYRQSPVLKEFRELGKLFLRLSGEKPVCGSLD